jgi:hypothetical protein
VDHVLLCELAFEGRLRATWGNPLVARAIYGGVAGGDATAVEVQRWKMRIVMLRVWSWRGKHPLPRNGAAGRHVRMVLE